ncbi:RE2, partial [Symbiodinium microadriaticum]
HAAFLELQVPAFTIRGVSAKGDRSSTLNVDSLAMSIESVVRCMSNALQQLHHSFNFYFFTGPSSHISNGLYLYPVFAMQCLLISFLGTTPPYRDIRSLLVGLGVVAAIAGVSGSTMFALAMNDELLAKSLAFSEKLACIRPEASLEAALQRRQMAGVWVLAGAAVSAIAALALRNYAFSVFSEDAQGSALKSSGVRLPCPLWESVRVACGFALLAVLAPVTIYSWALAMPLTIVCVPALVLVRPVDMRRRPLRSTLILAFLAGNAFLIAVPPNVRATALGDSPRLVGDNMLHFYERSLVPAVPREAQKYLPRQLVQWLQQGQLAQAFRSDMLLLLYEAARDFKCVGGMLFPVICFAYWPLLVLLALIACLGGSSVAQKSLWHQMVGGQTMPSQRGVGRVCGTQLRRITTAISDRELRTTGPVVKTWPEGEAGLEVGLTIITVILMGYCYFADPGQIKKTRNIPVDNIDLEQVLAISSEDPKICSGGALALTVAPIFRIHIRLVSRNELGHEWKNNLHYANQTSMGDGIPVHELDDDEYNELFDQKAFVYDKTRNHWDEGRTEKVYKKKTVKKGAGKELCYNRESQEVKQALDQARRKEWDNWKNYSNMQKLSREEFAKIKQKDPGLRIIPTKWVDTSKAEEGQPLKAKSRFVVRGDLEDASGMRTDSPTASQVAMGLLISFAASTSRPLRSGDISAAFLQGSVLDRSLVLSMPKNAAPYDMDEEDLVLVSTTVYETKDAPRGWFKKLDGSLQKKQLRRVPMEPGFYGLNGQGGDGSTCVRGLLLVHVDDILWTGDQHMEQIMKEIQAHTVGPGQRTAFANETERSQLRSVTGSLNWLVRVCRPHLAYGVAKLQCAVNKPTVQDLVDANALAKYAQKKEKGLFYKAGAMEFNEVMLVAIQDASYAADYDVSTSGAKMGYRSQSGRILCLAPKTFSATFEDHLYPIEWHSTVIRRVCKSTLQAESLSLQLGAVDAEHARCVLHGLYKKQPKMDATSWGDWSSRPSTGDVGYRLLQLTFPPAQPGHGDGGRQTSGHKPLCSATGALAIER